MTDLGNKEQVCCKNTGKLLARVSAEGIYLYCKQCHTEHFISWADLQASTRQSDTVTLGV